MLLLERVKKKQSADVNTAPHTLSISEAPPSQVEAVTAVCRRRLRPADAVSSRCLFVTFVINRLSVRFPADNQQINVVEEVEMTDIY